MAGCSATSTSHHQVQIQEKEKEKEKNTHVNMSTLMSLIHTIGTGSRVIYPLRPYSLNFFDFFFARRVRGEACPLLQKEFAPSSRGHASTPHAAKKNQPTVQIEVSPCQG
jgi:hypothetical protein